MMHMQHPDQASSSFNHAWGWCRACGKVLRIADPKYFRNEQGPACSYECVEKVSQTYWTEGISTGNAQPKFVPDGL